MNRMNTGNRGWTRRGFLRGSGNSLLIFHALHPFNCALVGTRKNRVHIAELGAQRQLPPGQVGQREFLDISQPHLRPYLGRRVRHDRMRQRRGNAQGLNRGVEHRGQARPALVIPLLAERPRLVFDNIFVDGRDQRPGRFECARKLELIEQDAEFADGLARSLGNRILGRSFPCRVRGMRHLAFEIPVNHG